MKTLKKILLALGLLLTSSITLNANDYALLNTYPLLNDMKMLKKEQLLLNNMRGLIADRKNNNKNKLRRQKEMFTAIITGLSKEDNTLNLQNTKPIFLKNKIKTIQLLWSQEKRILDSAVNNQMYKDDAYASIDKLSEQLNDLSKLYAQSYAKYKQNSVIKSLVSSYMRRGNTLQTEPMYAMNHIK